MSNQVFIVHIAGEMVEGVQQCSRCGKILIDYRNSAAAVMPGEPAPKLSGWRGFVGQSGNFSTTLDHDAREFDEQRCQETIQ